jgi:hypothetical protein
LSLWPRKTAFLAETLHLQLGLGLPNIAAFGADRRAASAPIVVLSAPKRYK